MFDFGIVELVSELGFMRLWLAPPDNLGVRLAQTDELVLRRNGFALKHSPHGLVYRTLDQRQQRSQLLSEARSPWVFLSRQSFLDLPGLS